jgi:hypothetical protein
MPKHRNLPGSENKLRTLSLLPVSQIGLLLENLRVLLKSTLAPTIAGNDVRARLLCQVGSVRHSHKPRHLAASVEPRSPPCRPYSEKEYLERPLAFPPVARTYPISLTLLSSSVLAGFRVRRPDHHPIPLPSFHLCIRTRAQADHTPPEDSLLSFKANYCCPSRT